MVMCDPQIFQDRHTQYIYGLDVNSVIMVVEVLNFFIINVAGQQC